MVVFRIRIVNTTTDMVQDVSRHGFVQSQLGRCGIVIVVAVAVVPRVVHGNYGTNPLFFIAWQQYQSTL